MRKFLPFKLRLSLLAAIAGGFGAVAQVPSTPVAIDASDILNTGCMSNWNTATGAFKYLIDVSTQPDFTAIMPPSAPWINEFHYDGVLPVGEFIELIIPEGYAGTNLKVSFYNAAGTVYGTRLFTQFVRGGSNPSGYRLYSIALPNDTLENETAGIALSDDASLIQFISYEGVVNATEGPAAGTSSIDIHVAESATTSLTSSISLRGLNGLEYSDFTWATSASTMAVFNSGQTFGTPITPVPAFVVPYENYVCYSNIQALSGLNAGTTYYYRIRAVANDETTMSEYSNTIMFKTMDPIIWNGAFWTKNNSPTTSPTIDDDVFIEGDFTFDANASGDGTFSAKNLRHRAGLFTMAPGTNLILAEGLFNDAGTENFIVNNNANIIQNNNDAKNGGAITVKKDSSPLYRQDYTIWSSPVTGQNLRAFSPATISSRFYVYNTESDEYVSTDTSGEFMPGTGYLIRMPNTHYMPGYDDGDTAIRYNGEFKGVPNNGLITVDIKSTGRRFNMVGNPFPSPINVRAFFDNNTQAIDNGSAIYFWRKKNNPGATSYATLTKAGYTANNAEGGDTGAGAFPVGGGASYVINPGQGFIVRARENAADLVFNDFMRVAVNNGQFFRTNDINAEPEISSIKLNIKGNTAGQFGQAIVAYTPEATMGIDYGWDGKLLNDGELKIYTRADDTELTIQARPAFNVNDVVALEYKAANAGSYTINLEEVNGVLANEDQGVFLIDKTAGLTHDLKAGAYTFATEAGTFNERFNIVYVNESLGTKPPVADANNIIIYKEGSIVNINSGALEMTGVTVYDISGRIIYNDTNISGNNAVISNLQPTQQMLIVQITTAQNLKVSKKLLF
jgi:hypothetical protein